MVTLAEIEKEAMKLNDDERAQLASFLLNSLSPAIDDDEIAEALRRDAEMENDPSACLTLEDVKRAVGR